MNLAKIKSLALLAYLFSYLSVTTINAQIDISGNLCLSTDADGNCLQTVEGAGFGTPAGIISAILPNIFIIAGIIVMFLGLLGGFTIISSSGNPEQIQKGQQTLVGAIIGFLVIFSSFWIVQLIELITGATLLDTTAIPGFSGI